MLIALGLLGVSIYHIPWVNQRAGWRVDIARTYLRGMLRPAGAVPTPNPGYERLVSDHSAASPFPLGSATVEVTESSPTYLAIPTEIPGTPVSQPVTLTPTRTLIPTPIPERVKLQAPGWEKQDWNNCGPAALSMYLRYYGWEGDQYSISAVLKPKREDRNVNVEELVYFARNYAGWLETRYWVGGDIQLLKEFTAAEIPVLIEASFFFDGAYWPNDDLWAAHYLLVNGYDEASQTFTVQDTFHGPNQILNYETLDEYWKPFNRVFILSYPLSQEATVKTILGSAWDDESNRQAALEAAQAEIDSDPGDGLAWFNLGTNLVYFERYAEASAAYDEARTIGWPQRMLRYQFGPFFAYFHAGRIEDLLTISEYALQRTYNSEEAFLWRGWARYRLGDFNGAISDFQAALEANYLYQDARYALDFVIGE